MRESTKIKYSFTRIKEDMQNMYNLFEDTKKNHELWLNNLINNQNIQLEKIQKLEHKMNSIEQQLNIVMQLVQQNTTQSLTNDQEWVLVTKKH